MYEISFISNNAFMEQALPSQMLRDKSLLKLSLHPFFACRHTSIPFHGSGYSVLPNSSYRFFGVFVVSSFVCVYSFPSMILLNQDSELMFLKVPCYLLKLKLGGQMRIKVDLCQMLNAYYILL